MTYSVPARLAEPSTYAGLSAIVMVIGQFFPQISPFTNLLAVILGGAAAALKERGAAS